MNYLQQVQRGVDYIELHLEEEITLDAVARAAGISQWHFQRIFKALTAETLKSYIRSRRLGRAVERLRSTDQRIIEIAMAAGFESQESFTRAFDKAFGVTPQRYRKFRSKQIVPRKAPIDAEHLQHLHQSLSLIPEIATRPAMHVVGLSTCFYSVDSDKNNIGQRLPAVWEAFLARLNEVSRAVQGCCYGVVQPTSDRDDLLDYVAAIEVEALIERPEHMVERVVPAATYAIFSHRGYPQEIDRTVDYIYSTWLLQSGRRHSGGPDLEIYGEGYQADSAASEFYYAIPIVDPEER